MKSMDDKIREVLSDFFDKYNVPKAAIEGATAQLIQIINNPVQAKYGAFVMTEAASRAGDRHDNVKIPQGKPQEL